jgi:hypothetical protein
MDDPDLIQLVAIWVQARRRSLQDRSWIGLVKIIPLGGKRDFFSAIGTASIKQGHPLKISASGGLPYWLKPPGGSPPQQATMAGLRQSLFEGGAPPLCYGGGGLWQKKSPACHLMG